MFRFFVRGLKEDDNLFLNQPDYINIEPIEWIRFPDTYLVVGEKILYYILYIDILGRQKLPEAFMIALISKPNWDSTCLCLYFFHLKINL